MRRRIEIGLEAPGQEGAVLIAPSPIAFWDQQFEGFEVTGAYREVTATNSAQKAYLITPEAGVAPVLSYSFVSAPGALPAPEIWEGPDSALTRASPDLAALAGEFCAPTGTVAERLRGLISHAAEMFDYDHPEERFNDGAEAVPTLCGTTKGSCVDINTFLLAGAKSVGITGQYIMGYWFGPERFKTPDAHCWLVFQTPEGPLFWDVAHHLKWGVSPLGAGLNPAGGRRLAFSAGRGLAFDTPNCPITISHFGEPVWVLPDGRAYPPEITITLTETVLEDA
ncbi:MAG: transglutaminase-like domain-containing protein [Pseudomonadota bacterium]